MMQIKDYVFMIFLTVSWIVVSLSLAIGFTFQYQHELQHELIFYSIASALGGLLVLIVDVAYLNRKQLSLRNKSDSDQK